MTYDEKYWFSLRFGVYFLWKLRKTLGSVVITSNKFQKEREAWIVAVTLLGISKTTNDTWWIQIPIDDPPDICAMMLTPNEDNTWNYVNYRDVEVMEVTQYSKRQIVDEIRKKIEGKYYGDKTALIVYLRRNENILDMNSLSDELQKKVSHIADIWIVGNTKPDTNEFVVFSVFPNLQVINFNIEEEVKKILPGDFIDLRRGKGIETTLVKGDFIPVFNPRRSKA